MKFSNIEPSKACDQCKYSEHCEKNNYCGRLGKKFTTVNTVYAAVTTETFSTMSQLAESEDTQDK